MGHCVVVTGGAGYIGSHICKELKQRGYFHVVIDNLSRGHREFVRWGPLILGSIGDRNLVREALTIYRPEAVIHCAGLTYVEEPTERPDLYYRNNVADGVVLLEEMLQAGVSKLIFSSTCATYGLPSQLPLSEEHAQLPIHPYGRSKFAFEQMIRDYAVVFPLRYAILRYFNAAGADGNREIGEKHDPETHLIPRILDVALGRRKEIEIYGTDYPTPDGSAVRDYVHVTDLADAHLLALEHLKENPSFAANLGTGTGISVSEMIAAAEKITRCQIRTKIKPRRAGDPPLLVADASKARTLLNWNPKLSDPDNLLSSALAWHRTI
jgi:UDP-glucose-4-epimerase GalE